MRNVVTFGEVDALDLESFLFLGAIATGALVLTRLSAPAPCELFDRARTNPGPSLSTLWHVGYG